MKRSGFNIKSTWCRSAEFSSEMECYDIKVCNIINPYWPNFKLRVYSLITVDSFPSHFPLLPQSMVRNSIWGEATFALNICMKQKFWKPKLRAPRQSCNFRRGHPRRKMPHCLGLFCTLPVCTSAFQQNSDELLEAEPDPQPLHHHGSWKRYKT